MKKQTKTTAKKVKIKSGVKAGGISTEPTEPRAWNNHNAAPRAAKVR